MGTLGRNDEFKPRMIANEMAKEQKEKAIESFSQKII